MYKYWDICYIDIDENSVVIFIDIALLLYTVL